ncbi:MAG: cytochrome c [Chloroflexi bacterium]|nr:cytochrome c [Chloroflexota bacterium]
MNKQQRNFFRIAVVLITVFAIGSAACGNGGGGDEAVSVERGEENFAICAACHGADAKGLPNLGKGLTTSEFVAGMSDSEFVDFIIEGRPATHEDNTTGVDMPPRGGNPSLTDDDIASIVAFVRTLQE